MMIRVKRNHESLGPRTVTITYVADLDDPWAPAGNLTMREIDIQDAMDDLAREFPTEAKAALERATGGA